jgi:hypothetical protein
MIAAIANPFWSADHARGLVFCSGICRIDGSVISISSQKARESFLSVAKATDKNLSNIANDQRMQ